MNSSFVLYSNQTHSYSDPKNRFSMDKSSEMNTFQSIRIYLAALGIYPAQSGQSHKIRMKSGFVLILMAFIWICMVSTLFFEADTFGDYINAFMNILTIFSAANGFVVYILNAEILFQFMLKFEDVIEKSKRIN